MPTFMTRATFDILTSVWRDLAEEFSKEEVGPSYIFVPWSGEQVAATGRGIYYVGIATDAEIAGGEPDFEAGLRGTERFCLHPTRGHAPFWRFLDRFDS